MSHSRYLTHSRNYYLTGGRNVKTAHSRNYYLTGGRNVKTAQTVGRRLITHVISNKLKGQLV
jgi:hypothetical protein